MLVLATNFSIDESQKRQQINCKTTCSAVIETISTKQEIFFEACIEHCAAFTTNCLTNKSVSDIGGTSWCNVDCCLDNVHIVFTLSGHAMIRWLINSYFAMYTVPCVVSSVCCWCHLKIHKEKRTRTNTKPLLPSNPCFDRFSFKTQHTGISTTASTPGM